MEILVLLEQHTAEAGVDDLANQLGFVAVSADEEVWVDSEECHLALVVHILVVLVYCLLGIFAPVVGAAVAGEIVPDEVG